MQPDNFWERSRPGCRQRRPRRRPERSTRLLCLIGFRPRVCSARALNTARGARALPNAFVSMLILNAIKGELFTVAAAACERRRILAARCDDSVLISERELSQLAAIGVAGDGPDNIKAIRQETRCGLGQSALRKIANQDAADATPIERHCSATAIPDHFASAFISSNSF